MRRALNLLNIGLGPWGVGWPGVQLPDPNNHHLMSTGDWEALRVSPEEVPFAAVLDLVLVDCQRARDYLIQSQDLRLEPGGVRVGEGTDGEGLNQRWRE